MKRKSVLIIFFFCILLSSASCNSTKEESSKIDLHEMIMIKGEIWKNTGVAMAVQVDDD